MASTFDENGFRLVFQDSFSADALDGIDLRPCKAEAGECYNTSKSTLKTESCTSMYEQSDSSLNISKSSFGGSCGRLAYHRQKSFKFEAPKMDSVRPVQNRRGSTGRSEKKMSMVAMSNSFPQYEQSAKQDTVVDDFDPFGFEDTSQTWVRNVNDSCSRQIVSPSRRSETTGSKGSANPRRRTKVKITKTGEQEFGSEDIEAARKLIGEHLARRKSRDHSHLNRECGETTKSKGSHDYETAKKKKKARPSELGGKQRSKKTLSSRLEDSCSVKSKHSTSSNSKSHEDASQASFQTGVSSPPLKDRDMDFGAAATMIAAKVLSGSLVVPKRSSSRPKSRTRSRTEDEKSKGEIENPSVKSEKLIKTKQKSTRKISQ